LWKPVQFSAVADLFANVQTMRLNHCLCMSAITVSLAIHIMRALLMPRSLIAMLTGGPIVADTSGAEAGAAPVAEAALCPTSIPSLGNSQ
jgi:hypothetical protein